MPTQTYVVAYINAFPQDKKKVTSFFMKSSVKAIQSSSELRGGEHSLTLGMIIHPTYMTLQKVGNIIPSAVTSFISEFSQLRA
ncbi:hypothetical protein, partial [Shewanella mangrovi]|uniref:hypothetical protein n=1 Tax=Shewanella mangrovi TaxID=1515746 RepID=UPI0019D38E24